MSESKLIDVIGLLDSTTNIIVHKGTDSFSMTASEWYHSNHKWLPLTVIQMQVEPHRWNTISVLLTAGQ